jgi:hypothetical protein
MKFNIDGVEYVIRFKHINRPEEGTRFTKAYLFSSKLPIENEVGWITIGLSYCNPIDNFCRAVGRKISFTRLLENMKELIIISSREDSRLVWEVYFETFKKGK